MNKDEIKAARLRYGLLDQVKLYRLVRSLFRSGKSEREITTVVFGPRPEWPMGPEECAAADQFDFFRGAIQGHYRAAQLPPRAERAWIAKCKGEQTWPRSYDVSRLLTAHREDCNRDPRHNLSKPGPLFLKTWEVVKMPCEASIVRKK